MPYSLDQIDKGRRHIVPSSTGGLPAPPNWPPHEWHALQISAFRAVALAAKQLEVLGRGRAAQGHGDDVVILQIERAAALDALAAVSFEDGTADFAGDGLALPTWPLLWVSSSMSSMSARSRR